jgi:hypothetical protein
LINVSLTAPADITDQLPTCHSKTGPLEDPEHATPKETFLIPLHPYKGKIGEITEREKMEQGY